MSNPTLNLTMDQAENAIAWLKLLEEVWHDIEPNDPISLAELREFRKELDAVFQKLGGNG